MAISSMPQTNARAGNARRASTTKSTKHDTAYENEPESRTVKIKRLSINLTEKSYSRLVWLQENTEALHVTDTVREALRIYDILVTEALNGKKITISDPDNPGEIEVMRLI